MYLSDLSAMKLRLLSIYIVSTNLSVCKFDTRFIRIIKDTSQAVLPEARLYDLVEFMRKSSQLRLPPEWPADYA